MRGPGKKKYRIKNLQNLISDLSSPQKYRIKQKSLKLNLNPIYLPSFSVCDKLLGKLTFFFFLHKNYF